MNKKELSAQYKERKIGGGVFLVKNTVTDNAILNVATDITGSRNRFDFSVRTDLCYDPRMSIDWAAHGKDSFVFEILETLDKGEAQTMKEFKDDLNILKEMWLEKLEYTLLRRFYDTARNN